MKPSSRRRVEREINRIMREDGDNCSLCRREFRHNDRTYGGVTKAGKPALVGECCFKGLAVTVLMGAFVTKDYEGVFSKVGISKGEALSPTDVEGAVAALRATIDYRGNLRDDAATRAGVKPAHTRLHLEDSEWKRDDAAWFEANPTRSHRLRAMMTGEAETFGPIAQQPLPPFHQLYVVVRQIEPGKRVRTPFGRNLAVPIADDEAVLHGLFDMLSAGGLDGGLISEASVTARALPFRKSKKVN